eukprot:COSAG02_NODE_1307_length_13340_cov_84.665282_9_plen_141_part_00
MTGGGRTAPICDDINSWQLPKHGEPSQHALAERCLGYMPSHRDRSASASRAASISARGRERYQAVQRCRAVTRYEAPFESLRAVIKSGAVRNPYLHRSDSDELRQFSGHSVAFAALQLPACCSKKFIGLRMTYIQRYTYA